MKGPIWGCQGSEWTEQAAGSRDREALLPGLCVCVRRSVRLPVRWCTVGRKVPVGVSCPPG